MDSQLRPVGGDDDAVGPDQGWVHGDERHGAQTKVMEGGRGMHCAVRAGLVKVKISNTKGES